MLPGAGKVLPEPPAADDGDERRGDDAEGRDSEEDADGNALVPVFRSFIKKNGALCCVFGLAMFVVLLVQAAVQWNMRPAWVKKVPCVLQPKLASIEGVLKAIDRYFIVTSLVPPLATVAYIAHHLVSTRKLPNSDYEPPKTKWMILIWSWKILTPLLVYIFIQVKADTFVGYEAMAQKLCEVSLSLTFYPPGTDSLEKVAQGSKMLRSFTVASAFTDLRNTSKLYFANRANHLYPSENEDLDFESELGQLQVDLDTPSSARRAGDWSPSVADDVTIDLLLGHLQRRAEDADDDEEWWKAHSSWKEPEESTCRQDVTVSVTNVTTKKAKRVDAGDKCVRGGDPDNQVYQALENFLEPQDFIARYCSKSITKAKREFGYSAADAAAWAIRVMTDHLDNIITGFSFSFTFCDAEMALKNRFLTLGGVKDEGSSAFTVVSADAAQQVQKLTSCQWITNDENWKSQVWVGTVTTKDACVAKVKTEAKCSKANLGRATIAAVMLIPSDNSASINYDCYCEWGSNIQPALQASTEICFLPAVLTPEQAQAAVSVKLPDVCAAFGSNAASVTSLSPGVLQWLDTLGISKRGTKAAEDFLGTLKQQATMARNRSNVDLCDTHMHVNATLDLLCLLMGFKDPQTNVNALASTLCPSLVDDLRHAAGACAGVSDVPIKSSGGAADARKSPRAECQVLNANGQDGAKLRRRVQMNTAEQKVKSQNFLHLLPQNYSSMRELVGRVAAGLFSPEKQSERVGTKAKPSSFSLAYALPADTQLEYFAGSCDGSNYALQVKAVFNANSKLYYSTVTPPTTSKSKTAAKTTNFFRDFTFPTCWEECKKFYPATIAVNGPFWLEQSSDNPVCSFPFKLNNTLHYSCIPKETLETGIRAELRAAGITPEDEGEADLSGEISEDADLFCVQPGSGDVRDRTRECRKECVCQTSCSRRVCDSSTSLASTASKITTAPCRDQSFLRWLEKFGKNDAKSSMVAAIKYMQERVLNEGTLQAELLKELVEAEGAQSLEMIAEFVKMMLPYGFPNTLTKFDEDNTPPLTILTTVAQFESWGGTCDDTRISSQCTQQMKDWDICRCIRTQEDLYWAIAFVMYPNWYLDPATQRWSIKPKDSLKPGCRSTGNQACASNYTYEGKHYGVARCYQEDSAFYCAKTTNPTGADADWLPCTCKPLDFPSGDNIYKGVNEFSKFLNQVMLDAVNSGLVMVQQATREFTQKIAASIASASNKIKYLIGVMIGTQSVIKLVPLALAVLSGVNKGFDKYSEMTESSGVVREDNDVANLRKAVVLVVSTATSVFILPMLVVVIFLYQGFATYYFIITIFGVIVMLFGKVFWLVHNAAARRDNLTFFQKRGPVATQVFALCLMIGGAVGWWASDKEFIEMATSWGGKKAVDFLLKKNAAFFYTLIFNMAFNYFYSSIATVIICSRIIGWAFKDYHIVSYKSGACSDLWKVNIHQRSYYGEVASGNNGVTPREIFPG